MGIRSYIKNTAKNNVNIKGWSSWGTIKEHANTVVDFARDMKPQKSEGDATAPTTFEAAMSKYGITEQDLPMMMKRNLIVAVFCASLGLVALLWAFYLFFLKGFYLSGFVGLALFGLMSSYAFRAHFNYYQIKSRRLDCTAREWLSHFFTADKK